MVAMLPPALQAVAGSLAPEIVVRLVQMEQEKAAAKAAVEGPPPAPKPDAETITNEVSTGSSKIFETYQSVLPFGMEHPGQISEASYFFGGCT